MNVSVEVIFVVSKIKNVMLKQFNAHTLVGYFLFSFTLLLFTGCKKENKNPMQKTLQTQVIGTWKLVKEHWQISNNQDTILTSWSTQSGAAIPPTIEFGNQVSGQWYTGGMDRMSWGGPCSNPLSRGNIQVNSMWSIQANTNKLLGAANAIYSVVHLDANSMILSQENATLQSAFDTLWLERL